MIKTILVMSDGREIQAGKNEENAIQSVQIEESCNDGEDLYLGSVCAKMIKVKIITPQNQMPIMAGEEFEVYEEENGNRQKKGVFIAEKPKRENANTTSITGYDRVSLLDKDLTDWFNKLSTFPSTPMELAQAVCKKCGLVFANSSVHNNDYEIRKVTIKNATGRQLMRWIAQICASFCIADRDGAILFRWYEPNIHPISVLPKEEHTSVLLGGLTFEDYRTKPIDGVSFVGAQWPNEPESDNIYTIRNNPFVPTDDSQEVIVARELAKKLYERLSTTTYTPCKVKIPAGLTYNVGDMVAIYDVYNNYIPAYIMNITRKGQLQTLECTGNYEISGASTLYSERTKDETVASNPQKTLGLEQKVADLERRIAALEQSINV